ncbi:hypothetical protein DTO212C5_200 [Paecilomyces variotii]|nr:hypothetical protein DTO212C5_200 [Paecilomyces variotii]
MESSEMAEAEARMAVGDDPQEQDGRDREGTQCVVDLELLGGGEGENQGLEKAGELGSLGGSKVVDLDDGGAKAISYSTMISKLQAVVQSDCQFGYVFAEPQGARPWFRPGKGFFSKNKPLTMLSSSLSKRSQKHSPPVLLRFTTFSPLFFNGSTSTVSFVSKLSKLPNGLTQVVSRLRHPGPTMAGRFVRHKVRRS